MKERPILFNDAMVRAIIDGRKTQTRRPVVRQPHEWPGLQGLWRGGRRLPQADGPDPLAPFGIPGHRLWVRECWAPNEGHEPFYRATDGEVGWTPLAGWRPSIHMPRWASRLTLEVTGVRVERVQDITQAGAVADGFGVSEEFEEYVRNVSPGVPHRVQSARERFGDVWDGIYAAKGLGWDDNPWVWVVEFKRVTP